MILNNDNESLNKYSGEIIKMSADCAGVYVLNIAFHLCRSPIGSVVCELINVSEQQDINIGDLMESEGHAERTGLFGNRSSTSSSSEVVHIHKGFVPG